MAQTNLTIRMDSEEKKTFSAICKNMGISVSSAFSIFTKAVIHSRRIPFEVKAEPAKDDFYNPENIKHLEKIKKLEEKGKLKFITKTLDELEAMAK